MAGARAAGEGKRRGEGGDNTTAAASAKTERRDVARHTSSSSRLIKV